MRLEQLDGDGVERALHRRDLSEDFDARPVFLDHPNHRAHLAFGAMEPVQKGWAHVVSINRRGEGLVNAGQGFCEQRSNTGRRAQERESHGERGPLTWMGGDVDPPVVRTDELVHDREADAGPSAAAGT